MPLVFRKVRISNWLEDNPPWLEEWDAPADPLGSLVTKDSTLSVWVVNEDESNLGQVVAAIAATRDNLANLDFALFDIQLLSELNIEIDEKKGGTPDKKANTLHLDLVKLSALKLVELSKVMKKKAKKIDRVLPKEVGALIAQAVDLKRISLDDLKPDLRAKIEPITNKSP